MERWFDLWPDARFDLVKNAEGVPLARLRLREAVSADAVARAVDAGWVAYENGRDFDHFGQMDGLRDYAEVLGAFFTREFLERSLTTEVVRQTDIPLHESDLQEALHYLAEAEQALIRAGNAAAANAVRDVAADLGRKEPPVHIPDPLRSPDAVFDRVERAVFEIDLTGNDFKVSVAGVQRDCARHHWQLAARDGAVADEALSWLKQVFEKDFGGPQDLEKLQAMSDILTEARSAYEVGCIRRVVNQYDDDSMLDPDELKRIWSHLEGLSRDLARSTLEAMNGIEALVTRVQEWVPEMLYPGGINMGNQIQAMRNANQADLQAWNIPNRMPDVDAIALNAEILASHLERRLNAGLPITSFFEDMAELPFTYPLEDLSRAGTDLARQALPSVLSGTSTPAPDRYVNVLDDLEAAHLHLAELKAGGDLVEMEQAALRAMPALHRVSAGLVEKKPLDVLLEKSDRLQQKLDNMAQIGTPVQGSAIPHWALYDIAALVMPPSGADPAGSTSQYEAIATDFIAVSSGQLYVSSDLVMLAEQLREAMQFVRSGAYLMLPPSAAAPEPAPLSVDQVDPLSERERIYAEIIPPYITPPQNINYDSEEQMQVMAADAHLKSIYGENFRYVLGSIRHFDIDPGNLSGLTYEDMFNARRYMGRQMDIDSKRQNLWVTPADIREQVAADILALEVEQDADEAGFAAARKIEVVSLSRENPDEKLADNPELAEVLAIDEAILERDDLSVGEALAARDWLLRERMLQRGHVDPVGIHRQVHAQDVAGKAAAQKVTSVLLPDYVKPSDDKIDHQVHLRQVYGANADLVGATMGALSTSDGSIFISEVFDTPLPRDSIDESALDGLSVAQVKAARDWLSRGNLIESIGEALRDGAVYGGEVEGEKERLNRLVSDHEHDDEGKNAVVSILAGAEQRIKEQGLSRRAEVLPPYQDHDGGVVVLEEFEDHLRKVYGAHAELVEFMVMRFDTNPAHLDGMTVGEVEDANQWLLLDERISAIEEDFLEQDASQSLRPNRASEEKTLQELRRQRDEETPGRIAAGKISDRAEGKSDLSLARRAEVLPDYQDAGPVKIEGLRDHLRKVYGAHAELVEAMALPFNIYPGHLDGMTVGEVEDAREWISLAGEVAFMEQEFLEQDERKSPRPNRASEEKTLQEMRARLDEETPGRIAADKINDRTAVAEKLADETLTGDRRSQIVPDLSSVRDSAKQIMGDTDCEIEDALFFAIGKAVGYNDPITIAVHDLCQHHGIVVSSLSGLTVGEIKDATQWFEREAHVEALRDGLRAKHSGELDEELSLLESDHVGKSAAEKILTRSRQEALSKDYHIPVERLQGLSGDDAEAALRYLERHERIQKASMDLVIPNLAGDEIRSVRSYLERLRNEHADDRNGQAAMFKIEIAQPEKVEVSPAPAAPAISPAVQSQLAGLGADRQAAILAKVTAARQAMGFNRGPGNSVDVQPFKGGALPLMKKLLDHAPLQNAAMLVDYGLSLLERGLPDFVSDYENQLIQAADGDVVALARANASVPLPVREAFDQLALEANKAADWASPEDYFRGVLAERHRVPFTVLDGHMPLPEEVSIDARRMAGLVDGVEGCITVIDQKIPAPLIVATRERVAMCLHGLQQTLGFEGEGRLEAMFNNNPVIIILASTTDAANRTAGLMANSGKAVQVRLSPYQMQAGVHELAHAVDFTRRDSQDDLYALLKDLKENVEIALDEHGIGPDDAKRKYYLDPAEIFARTITKLVEEKAGDPGGSFGMPRGFDFEPDIQLCLNILPDIKDYLSGDLPTPTYDFTPPTMGR